LALDYLLIIEVSQAPILGGYIYPIPAENLCQNANTGHFSPTDTFFVIAGGLKGSCTGGHFTGEKFALYCGFPGRYFGGINFPSTGDKPCLNANAELLWPLQGDERDCRV